MVQADRMPHLTQRRINELAEIAGKPRVFARLSIAESLKNQRVALNAAYRVDSIDAAISLILKQVGKTSGETGKGLIF